MHVRCVSQKHSLNTATETATEILKDKNVLVATEALEVSHLSPEAIAAQEALT